MKPRVALVQSISPLEWRIRPDIETWADVRLLDDDGQLEDRSVLVGDEWGVWKAVSIAERTPGLVEGLALGHATLYEPRVDDVQPEVWDAYKSMARLDYRSFARALTQVSAGSYGDEIVDRFLETVPHEQLLRSIEEAEGVIASGPGLTERIRALNVPMLFARHTQCLLWTREGFDAAREAFPHAECVAVEDKPSVSSEFAEALRRFCESLEG